MKDIEVNTNKIEDILELSSLPVQTMKWMEELAELIQALAKNDRASIQEELCDVIISTSQIIKAHGFDEEVRTLNSIIDRKLDRTIYRLKLEHKEDELTASLSDCPMCGSRPRIIIIPGSCDYMSFVECPECEMRTKLYDTKELAAAHWEDGRRQIIALIGEDNE